MNARSSRVRYLVLGWFCLAAMIAYICRNSISAVEKTLREELHDIELLGRRFTPMDQTGWVMGAFFLTYALLQLPTGWLGHVLGSRRALPLFMLLGSAMTGVMGFAWGLPLLLLSRLGNGGAQAGIFPCTTGSVARWFPLTGRGLANGFIASFMSVGGALGVPLTALLLPHLGWRWIFLIYSILGVIWAVGFYLWFHDHPEEHAAVNAQELAVIHGVDVAPERVVPRHPPEPTPWRAILTSWPMWCINGQQFFRAAGYVFFGTWFTTFLQETRGVKLLEASWQTSLPLLAVVIGSPMGGWLSDRVLMRTGSRRLSRQGVAVAGLLGCAALTLAAYPVANAWLAVLVLSAGSFCAGAAGPCGYSITIDMGGRHVTTVFSMMNMAGNIAAFLYPSFVVPKLVKMSGWEVVYFSFVGIYLAAAVCWIAFNPNGTIAERTTRSES